MTADESLLTERPDVVGQLQATELRADKLEVRFGGVAAFADVTLKVCRHEVFGLIGPNGAGKTTLVNCLTGFQRPTSGRVLLGGDLTDGWSPDKFRKQGVARTFQSGRLFRDMTVLENIEVTAVALGLTRRAAAQRAMAMLDWIGLAEQAHRVAGTLAYTDERRVGIARALILSPVFLLLDEPAAGMSDAECEGLAEWVATIPRRFDCGVLLIEHNMRVIMGVCDRIHVLDGGRTLAEGKPSEIQDNPEVIAAYLGMEP